MAMDDKVAQTSGSQPDRVAALAPDPTPTQDLVAQLVQMQKSQDSLAQQQTDLPSMGDQLKSPAGIASLLAALGGAATGDANLAVGGAGVLEGFMGQSGAQTDQRRGAIQSAQQQTQKILDANRQRLSTMITSRPDLFIDPVTEESVIDPRVLGYAATGFMIPVNVGTSHHLAKQTATQRLTLEMGTKLMLDGDTPEKRRQGGVIVSNTLGLGLDDQFFETIAGQDDASRWSIMLSRDSLDPVSVLAAWSFASQNGRQMGNPEVIGMLRGSKKGSKLTIEDHTLGLIGEFDKIMGEAEGALQNEPLEAQLEYAFENRAGDLATMKKHFLGTDAFGTGVNGSQMLSMMRSTGEMLTMMYLIQPDMPWLKQMEINNVDDIWKKVGGMSDSALAYVRQAQADAAGVNIGMKTAQLRGMLLKDDPTMDFGKAASDAARMVQEAKTSSSSAGGSLDIEAFNAKIDSLMGD